MSQPETAPPALPNVFCVRAEFGTYTKQFVDGGYVAIGWIPNTDLSSVTSREQLYPLYKKAHPADTSNIVVGQQVGQVARFLFDMKPDDYVITPASDTELLRYGRLLDRPSYIYPGAADGCPYPQRRRVEWAASPLKRSGLSVPLQNTLRSSLTVFAISQREEFLAAIGKIKPGCRPFTTRIARSSSRFLSSTIRSSRFWLAIYLRLLASRDQRWSARPAMAGLMPQAS